uniref:Uncharacterized protein n=1 Tax=Avena sativa TaxID=4498 RepID=A0ACD5T8Q2_AVESA
MIQAVAIHEDVQDSFRWKFATDGSFLTRSTYLACFAGRTALPAATQVWSTSTPLKYKFFGWLAIQNRCWTVERLQRRGLPNHGTCPLCELENGNESLDHILLQCSFSRSV